MIEVKQQEEDGIANMKDNRTLEQKIRAMYTEESDLYYGSDKARDTYAKDTPCLLYTSPSPRDRG